MEFIETGAISVEEALNVTREIKLHKDKVFVIKLKLHNTIVLFKSFLVISSPLYQFRVKANVTFYSH